MSEIRLNIDGREVTGFEGQTILDIARENGINIPTLCHDDRVKMYGSCGICVVEAENSPRLMRSCSTFAMNGMLIKTDSEKVRKSRKTALELLLSDHTGDCRPPCALACPAETDCQGYVGLIANGEYKESLKLIKDKIPLPGSIGRVCPHPCEDACRRKMVEEPISIAALKAFAADKDMASGKLYAAKSGEDTGKRVAIAGGGPGGLSAAYYLRVLGHAVTVYDAMPKMGGMLRYGIPEYRLPKAYLQKEIDAIEGMGVKFRNGIKIGRDITLDTLAHDYDAVILAVGAWTSVGLNCKGEELDGVVGGIDFLRVADINEKSLTGKNVAVVGGGNTAMDACRTAVRLGAKRVYNIYRRTKAEMPAEEIEIIEAEEEGVIFKNLTNPLEVVGENGAVKAVRLQLMELGEPDASGRRAPVAIEGAEETLEVDAVIVAIGQKTDAVGLDGIDLTRWKTISADEHTFLTSRHGVFAIGDATNDGAGIAISAIGEAKKSASMVDKYLNGEKLAYVEPFLVKTEPTESDFADKIKAPRAKMPHRKPEERMDNFLEVNFGLSDEAAKREADRCLECGCIDYFECKLIDLANSYDVKPEKFEGAGHVRKIPTDHPFIERNPDKCILCGLCVRICDEVAGATALGLVGRGFDTIVKPALDFKLQDTDCISCGQCISACPTGALAERMMTRKQVPVRELTTQTTCAFCGVGCTQQLAHTGNLLTRALPYAEKDKDALLCMNGRFGFGELRKIDRLKTPLILKDAGLEPASYDETVEHISGRLGQLIKKYGPDSVGVTISPRLTNEEAFLIKEYANRTLGTKNVYSIDRLCDGMAEVIGTNCSTVGFDELENTDCILIAEYDTQRSHAVAGMAVRRAVSGGAKLITLNSFDSAADEMAAISLKTDGTLSLLKQIVKAAMEIAGKNISGYAELAEALKDVVVSADAKAAADMYVKAKKAVIVFEHSTVSSDAARLLADLAVLSGHLGKPREGILQLRPGANSQGLADLGVLKRGDFKRALESGELKGLVVFGEDAPELDFSGLEFLAVQDLTLTATAGAAGAVLPAQSFAEVNGTFTNTVGKTGNVRASLSGIVERDNIELVLSLAKCMGKPLPYIGLADIAKAYPKPERGLELRLVPPKGDSLRCKHDFYNTNSLYVSFMNFAKAKGVK